MSLLPNWHLSVALVPPLGQGRLLHILRPTCAVSRGRESHQHLCLERIGWVNIVPGTGLREARRARENQEVAGEPGLHYQLPDNVASAHTWLSHPCLAHSAEAPEPHKYWLVTRFWHRAATEGQCRVVGGLRPHGWKWLTGISWNSRGFQSRMVFNWSKKHLARYTILSMINVS